MPTDIDSPQLENTTETLETSQSPEPQDDLHDFDISFPSSRHNARAFKKPPGQSKKLKWRAKGKLGVAGNRCHLLDLPDDVLRVLLTRIPPRGLKVLSETCKELREVLREDSIWRESYVYRFFEGITTTTREDVKVLVQGCLEYSRGWKKEGTAREAMLERWIGSQAAAVPHHPPVGLVHSLSLSYPSPVPPRPPPLIVGKTHQTPSKSDNGALGTPSSLISDDGVDIPSTPTKMTHRQKYDALIAATTRPPPNVLSAGLGVGGVVRSDPLSGKVSKGFWGPGRDANFHLRPHLDHHSPPTTIHLPPRDQKFILWGLLTGMVVHTTILTKHPSTPGSRANSINLSCDSAFAHGGEVLDVYTPDSAPTDSPLRFVTGGADGKVKYWEVHPPQRSSGKQSPAAELQGSMSCLFTSHTRYEPFETRSDVVKLRQTAHPDAIILVRCEQDVICGVTEDGDLRIWWDFETYRREARVDVGSVEEFGEVKRLEMDVDRSDKGVTISVLLHHRRAPTFSRWDIITEPNGDYTVKERSFSTPFGASLTAIRAYLTPTPPISVVPKPLPALSANIESGDDFPQPLETSRTRDTQFGRFVVAGDNEGSVWIWPWDGVSEEIKPIRACNAMDRKVTALDYHCGLLAIGSCDAYIKVFDPLPNPPTLLRTFRASHLSPADTALAQSDEFDAQFYSVNQIILENDLIVASVGRKVFCWKAGGGKKRQSEGKKGKGSSGKTSKGISKAIDMRSVQEDALDMIDTPSKSERRQTAAMEDMGLEDPDEALQYAMMLSMEETTQPQSQSQSRDESSTGTPTGTSDISRGISDSEENEAVRAVEEFRQREEEEMRDILEMIRIAEERDARQ